MEEFMKKKIIILVSIIAFLLLIGGGIATYYLWYMPAQKKEAEKKFDHIIENYIDEFFALLEQNKFIQAQELLKDYRSFFGRKKSDKQLHRYYCSYNMENSLWYIQNDYEKMKANFPEMERLLKKIEKSKLSEDEKLIVKWTFATDNYRYFYRNRAYKKAIDILENFTKESGGEKRLERIDLLFSVYSYKADCLLKLDKTEEGIKYKQKALLSTDDSRAQHVLYLDLATIEINRKNFSSACEYILKASKKYTSQKGYFCLALVHLKQGRKDEAKKYYSLALACRKFPVVLEEDFINLKKILFQ